MEGWKFFVLRFSRLYPLHFVTLLLVALLQPVYYALSGNFFVYLDNDLSHFLAQLFMASDWGIVHGYSFDGPIWSISVEVVVYVLFFLMLLGTRSWLLNVAVVAACAGAAFVHTSGQVTNCLALFYIGGLAAIARRAVASSRFRWAIEAAAWLVVLIALPLTVSLMHDRLNQIDFPLFLTYTPVLLFCLSREITMPASVQTVVEAAGNMTYSSYLLHFPIQLMVVIGFTMLGTKIPLCDVRFFGIYLAAILLVSYLAYRYFEAPAQNLIRTVLLRPRTSPAGTVLGIPKA